MNNKLQIAKPQFVSSSVRLVILTFGFFSASLSIAAESVQEWLGRMSEAVEMRNYQGTLVYMRPGMAQTFSVYHRVEDGVATERLVSMGGEGAEIIRTHDEVICIFPENKKVVVDKRHDVKDTQNPLRANLPEYSPELQQSYDLKLLPDDRVAGLQAVVVSISPRDQFRYGYRIWLEEQPRPSTRQPKENRAATGEKSKVQKSNAIPHQSKAKLSQQRTLTERAW